MNGQIHPSQNDKDISSICQWSNLECVKGLKRAIQAVRLLYGSFDDLGTLLAHTAELHLPELFHPVAMFGENRMILEITTESEDPTM